jgi:hypothetical protein
MSDQGAPQLRVQEQEQLHAPPAQARDDDALAQMQSAMDSADDAGRGHLRFQELPRDELPQDDGMVGALDAKAPDQQMGDRNDDFVADEPHPDAPSARSDGGAMSAPAPPECGSGAPAGGPPGIDVVPMDVTPPLQVTDGCVADPQPGGGGARDGLGSAPPGDEGVVTMEVDSFAG